MKSICKVFEHFIYSNGQRAHLVLIWTCNIHPGVEIMERESLMALRDSQDTSVLKIAIFNIEREKFC